MQDVFVFLAERGYTGYLLTGEKLVPVEEFRQEVHQKSSASKFWDAPDYFNNFLFCRPETRLKWML